MKPTLLVTAKLHSHNVLAVQVIDAHAGKGFRVLAMARGTIRGYSRHSLGPLALEQLERQADSFSLLGLLILSNQLREDSLQTMALLQRK